MKNIEVLAPAGSLEICKAVIRAGADAVYLGGDMFGARAYAGNLNMEEMLEALDYAHIRDAKIYLTVNTLLKEDEINEKLIDYLKPYYEAGLDAVIVQDLGVFNVIRSFFPDLNIHASTQMTVTGYNGARILKDMGASRIVTARELTSSEIRQIHDNVDIEIEAFVHGALCYCYSGQCLLSSMNGNRSGNRGRCAQSCRMMYDVYNRDRQVNKTGECYPLSPKDMCALYVLPDVIDTGVFSLKIEGRMKNVTYAAGVTNIYRKYVDMYLEKGRSGYEVDRQDVENLMDIYNRGGFTDGYFTGKKGRDMMWVERPNHMGTKALQVISNVNGKVTFKALRDIYPQDVFEIDSDNSFSSGGRYRSGDTFIVNLPRKYPLSKDRVLFRTRNNNITRYVAQEFADNNKNGCKPVDMKLCVSPGEPLELNVRALGMSAVVTGPVVDVAENAAAKEDDVRERLKKLGNTDFVPGEIEAVINGKCFLPVAWINDIRRQGIDRVKAMILDSSRRTFKQSEDISVKSEGAGKLPDLNKNHDIKESVLVSCESQLVEITDIYQGKRKISDVYVEREVLTDKGLDLINKLIESGVNVLLALPHIITQNDIMKCSLLINKAVKAGITSFLVRNLEQIGLLGSIMPGAGIVTDANLYCWNSKAFQMLRTIIEKCGLKLIRVTYPYELTVNEINKIYTDCDMEFVRSTYIPVMVSKQCVRKTYGLCDGAGSVTVIKDRNRGRSYNVLSKCDYCYSLMLNSQKLDVPYDSSIIGDISPDYLRTEFNFSKESVQNIDRKSDSSGKEYMAHLVTGVE